MWFVIRWKKGHVIQTLANRIDLSLHQTRIGNEKLSALEMRQSAQTASHGQHLVI